LNKLEKLKALCALLAKAKCPEDAFDRMYVDGRALVTTPYHRAANRLAEIARDQGRHGSCFSGDTRVFLMDGTTKTMKELAENFQDKQFWVYSCTHDGCIVPGLASFPRKTRANAALLKIILDTGAEIKCTPDHKFMLRNGQYRTATELQPGDSLMPLYRRRHELYRGGLPYEQVLFPNTDQWHFTHRIAYPRVRSGNVRHHRDFNRFNNSPNNFIELTWAEHRLLHQKRGWNLKEWMKNPKNKEKFKASTKGSGKRGAKYLLQYNQSKKVANVLVRLENAMVVLTGLCVIKASELGKFQEQVGRNA